MPSLSRTQRRAAERKAAKLARKQNAANPTAATQAGTTPAAPISTSPSLYKAPPPPPNIDQMDPESPEFETYVLQLIRETEERHGIFETEPPRLTSTLPPPAAPAPAPTPAATPTRRAAANRENAQLSSGPRSPQGKLASSRNSLKHGLASGDLIIPGEDPAHYEALLADLISQHKPANPTEDLLVNELAQSYWLTQRALRLQNRCFETGQVDEKQLALYLRYQTTHQRAFHKALATLVRLQKEHSRELASRVALKEQVEAALAKPIPDISHILEEFSNPPSGFVSQNTLPPNNSDLTASNNLPDSFEFRNPAHPNRQKTAA